MRMKKGVIIGLMLVLALALTSGVGLAAEEAKPEMFPCVAGDKLSVNATPEAELTKLECYFDDYKKAKSLYLAITVKNVSKEPQRFRVQIFLDNGKAVGGLIPRKTKKGLIEPGATATFAYPVQAMEDKPGAIELFIKKASH